MTDETYDQAELAVEVSALLSFWKARGTGPGLAVYSCAVGIGLAMADVEANAGKKKRKQIEKGIKACIKAGEVMYAGLLEMDLRLTLSEADAILKGQR